MLVYAHSLLFVLSCSSACCVCCVVRSLGICSRLFRCAATDLQSRYYYEGMIYSVGAIPLVLRESCVVVPLTYRRTANMHTRHCRDVHTAYMVSYMRLGSDRRARLFAVKAPLLPIISALLHRGRHYDGKTLYLP